MSKKTIFAVVVAVALVAVVAIAALHGVNDMAIIKPGG